MISSTETKGLAVKEKNQNDLKCAFMKKYKTVFFKDGKFFYIVSNEWIKQWEAHYFGNAKTPGRIKNDVLFDKNEKLIKGLQLGKDYQSVNKHRWRFWYSMYGGGPCIKRNLPDIYSEEVPSSEKDFPDEPYICSTKFNEHTVCNENKKNVKNYFCCNTFNAVKETNAVSRTENENVFGCCCASHSSSPSVVCVMPQAPRVCDIGDNEGVHSSPSSYPQHSTFRSTCKQRKEEESSNCASRSEMRKEEREDMSSNHNNILISKEHDIFNKAKASNSDNSSFGNSGRQGGIAVQKPCLFCRSVLSNKKTNSSSVDSDEKSNSNEVFAKYEPSYPQAEDVPRDDAEDCCATKVHKNRNSGDFVAADSYAASALGPFEHTSDIHSKFQKHSSNSDIKKPKTLETPSSRDKKTHAEPQSLAEGRSNSTQKALRRRNEITGDPAKSREHEKQSHFKFLSAKEKEESSNSLYDAETSEEKDDASFEFSTDNKMQCNLPAGLRNMTNTCFMNAALQCFVGIPNFANRLNKCVNKTHDPITQEFKNIIVKLNEASNSSSPCCVPDKLRNILMQTTQNLFENCSQQDSHEFIRLIIGKLQESLKTRLKEPRRSEIENEVKNVKNPDVVAQMYWNFYMKYNNSLMAEFFAGQLRSRVECSACLNLSDTYDPIWDLSISLGSERTTLTNELTKFFGVEELEYKCEKCKRKTTAKKQFYVTHSPKVLLIHLKRFSSCLTKIHAKVDFPLNCLDMSKHLGGAEYALVGVIQHWGSSGSAGHYISYVMRNGNWFRFDDECVEAVTKLTVLKCDAYCLFYYRIS